MHNYLFTGTGEGTAVSTASEEELQRQLPKGTLTGNQDVRTIYSSPMVIAHKGNERTVYKEVFWS